MLNCNEIKALLGPAAHIYTVVWICLCLVSFHFESSVTPGEWQPELCRPACATAHSRPALRWPQLPSKLHPQQISGGRNAEGTQWCDAAVGLWVVQDYHQI